ncbi:lactonase family protein [Sphingobacterium sp. N143]|uniref:lactonase family protein n=1 Tax=Sphingobacterium sp. N143 TaxID=2746727 RepID=UPI00257793F4|nr:lactonase family protein [Sphingobacterium sp. N143]MDM1293537.1 lactonase family protein [Sphingobacterium sp. N143]
MKKAFIYLMTLLPLTSFAQQIPMFVGTYTNNTESKGIYVYNFDTKTGEASLISTQESKDPSFLARNNNFVYAVNEVPNEEGTVSAYSFKDGQLTFLNSLPSGGESPCFVEVHPKGSFLAVANYGGGSAALFDLESNGVLSKRNRLIQHEGKGVDPSRQDKPHVHSAFFSKKGERLYIQDLGMDQISAYTVNKSGNLYSLSEEPEDFFTPAGGGPRHIAFDKKEKFLYVILEMTGQIASYKKEGTDWMYQRTYEINPEGFDGKNGGADIKVSADGKFLYATNRGDANTIATFSVEKDGELKKLSNTAVKGNGPRNFNLSPDGKYLLVANQYTNNIVLFKRDTKTGLLTDAGKEITVPAPVCIIF